MKQGRTDAEINKAISEGRDAYQEYSLIEKKFDLFEESIFKAFSNTKSTDSIARDNLWNALQIKKKVLEYLTQDINDGKLAMKYVAEIERVGKPTILERILP